MECNKDEALRAKELAEKKFMVKDMIGARKLVLKAQNLYPGLEGIPQMIAALDVYLSAANKINGEADWYGILGVNAQADDETVRRHYRKLALMLHPDKNKLLGADGAFKLVSEAWSILSDKTRRLEYDQKRKVSAFQKISTHSRGSPTQQGVNGYPHVKKTTASNLKPPKSAPRTGQTSTNVPKQKSNTFWTVCHRCKMQYEYLRVYLNHNLLCPHCHEPFLAMETAPPSANGSKTWTFTPQRHSSRNEGATRNAYNSGRNNTTCQNAEVHADQYGQTSFQWSPFTKASGASKAAQAASMVQKAYDKVRREREEAQAAARKEDAMRRKQHVSKRHIGSSQSGQAKRRKCMEDAYSSSRGPTTNQTGTGGVAGKTNSLGAEACWINGRHKPSEKKDSSQFNIQELLVEKAKKEICKKLHDLNTFSTSSAAPLNLAMEENPVITDDVEENRIKPDAVHDTKTGESLKENEVYGIPNSFRFSTDAEALEAMSVNVPDSEFYNFDIDRIEGAFEDNQVWAAYDDDDGMPRYYAIIHNVISLSPFMMRISWLRSRANTQSGQLNWISSILSKTCGDFRIGRHEIHNSLLSFSHKVEWTKDAYGIIRIYPRRGEVWALYRNWSPNWNELTADEVIHKYDMVEILEDYNEKLGVTVIPLIKVVGFKTVFHQHLDPRTVKRISRDEMLRFSHQVPSHLITGQEAPLALKGCRELDPAAIPVELLHVVLNVEEDVQENAEHIAKDVQEIAENSEDVQENVEKLEEDVQEIAEKIGEYAQENSENIEEDVQENIERIEEDVQENIERIEEDVLENIERIEEDVQENIERIEEDVQENLERIEEDVQVEPDVVMVID